MMSGEIWFVLMSGDVCTAHFLKSLSHNCDGLHM